MQSLSGMFCGYELPAFHSVTRLELEVDYGYGLEFLKEFLDTSPNLEILILENVRADVTDDWFWLALLVAIFDLMGFSVIRLTRTNVKLKSGLCHFKCLPVWNCTSMKLKLRNLMG